MKRGALDVVAEELSLQPSPQPHLLSLLAKHKTEGGGQGLAATTMRYISNRPATARMLGTGQLTQWLAV